MLNEILLGPFAARHTILLFNLVSKQKSLATPVIYVNFDP